jgi:hypothetical protein
MAALAREDTGCAVPDKGIRQRYAAVAARNKSGRARLRARDPPADPAAAKTLSKKYT